MAWEVVSWACGHNGHIQMYGPLSGRTARQAQEAEQKCFACWLLRQWASGNDPRAGNVDAARAIAEGNGIHISPFALAASGAAALRAEAAELRARAAELERRAAEIETAPAPAV